MSDSQTLQKPEQFRKKLKRVIIWDLDGTLRSASSIGLHIAYQAILRAKGKNPDDYFTDLESFLKWFNHDWHRAMEKIDGKPYVCEPAIDKLFHEIYDPHVALFPWVKNFLPIISEKYLNAVLSSSSELSIKKELVGVASYFDVIVGHESTTYLKPHPEGIFFILNELQVEHHDAIIIGDNTPDILAGKAAGIWTGAVGWGLGDPEEIRALHPDWYFETPEQLMDFFTNPGKLFHA